MSSTLQNNFLKSLDFRQDGLGFADSPMHRGTRVSRALRIGRIARLMVYSVPVSL